MKKLWKFLLAGFLLMGCTDDTTGTVENIPVYQTVSRGSGEVIDALQSDTALILEPGQTARTYLFDFRVNDAGLYEQYNTLQPVEDSYYLVVNITLENRFADDVQVNVEDFAVLCMKEDWSLADGNATVESYFKVYNKYFLTGFLNRTFTLEGETYVKGNLLYLVPKDYRNFSLGYADLVEIHSDPLYWYVDLACK